MVQNSADEGTLDMEDVVEGLKKRQIYLQRRSSGTSRDESDTAQK